MGADARARDVRRLHPPTLGRPGQRRARSPPRGRRRARPARKRAGCRTGTVLTRRGAARRLTRSPAPTISRPGMESLRAVRGMNDILPEEVVRWQRLEAAFRRHAELHGYAEVRTPLIEHTALFRRQVGETTDIVEKEMYSFERHGDDLTVRPEGTAGAARAYVEHQVATQEPVSRWYYLGPMFRGERPGEGALPPVLPGRVRALRRPGAARRRRGDQPRLRASSASSASASFVVHVNSLGSGDTRDALPRRAPRALRALEGQAQRGLAAPPRDEPAAHPRLQGPAGSRGGRRARPRSSTCSTRTDREHWRRPPAARSTCSA